MTYKLIESPIELTDDQLDMVAAAGGGLVDIDDSLNSNLDDNQVNANVSILSKVDQDNDR